LISITAKYLSPTLGVHYIEAVLLAPTAVNRQAVKIEGKGNEVTLSYAQGFLGKADLGICRYFFELGAGKENFVFVKTEG
ncbi:MAG: nitroreductase family protein, partial [Erysipelotrichaceae bacterium]|nr:nitroreductase family protein [Erysipelotrichaceae bacterium]